MTKEEIMELNFEQVEERRNAIVEEIEKADSEMLETLSEELDAIEERKGILKAEAEEKKAEMLEVLNGEGEVREETEIKEEKKMDFNEIRKSPEYLDAWVEMQKGKMDKNEFRALFTTNADLGSGNTGTIAVPTYVEDVIHTAWENNEIMRRVRRTFYKGNLKVGYEASAEAAVIHEEGDEAISEENLVIGFVELIAKTVKKMVKYSTEVMDIKGQAFVDYIFDEIEYQLVKKVVSEILTAMSTSTLSASVSAAGASITTADIVNAEGYLGGEASDPVLIISRSNAAALKSAALSAQYGYDPFDGLPVIYADMPTGFEAFVADLSGVQANFPNGDQPAFVFDEFTEAPADIVRVIGRLLVAVDVVAPGKVVAIGEGSE